jgi:hypothetical protein
LVGGIFIHETSHLILGGVGVRTQAGNGDISVVVTSGDLTVNSAVTAHGAGDVELQAVSGTASLNSVVSSTSGSAAVIADSVLQFAAISTGGAGNVSVVADGGDIFMMSGSGGVSDTVNGSISYTATASVHLKLLHSTTGDISVTADSDANSTGKIELNSFETPLLQTSGTATLFAAEGIGMLSAIQVDVGSLVATNSSSGDIAIRSTSDLTISGDWCPDVEWEREH